MVHHGQPLLLGPGPDLRCCFCPMSSWCVKLALGSGCPGGSFHIWPERVAQFRCVGLIEVDLIGNTVHGEDQYFMGW